MSRFLAVFMILFASAAFAAEDTPAPTPAPTPPVETPAPSESEPAFSAGIQVFGPIYTKHQTGGGEILDYQPNVSRYTFILPHGIESFNQFRRSRFPAGATVLADSDCPTDVALTSPAAGELVVIRKRDGYEHIYFYADTNGQGFNNFRKSIGAHFRE